MVSQCLTSPFHPFHPFHQALEGDVSPGMRLNLIKLRKKSEFGWDQPAKWERLFMTNLACGNLMGLWR